MYLWKYWRESRITFGVALFLVALLFWGALRATVGPGQHGLHFTANISLLMGAVFTFPFSFLAWRFGSFGVGRELGDKCGTYLFTRPRSRAFFVWSDWVYGMAQLLATVVAANMVLMFAIYRASEDRTVHIALQSVSLLYIFSLHCAASLLLTGLIFGLTYFCSVLTRGHGLTLAVGVLLAYLIAKSVVHHYWQGITLPDITLTEFDQSPTGKIGFAGHLGLSIALRAVVALAFPLAAQWLLQTSDID